MPHPGMRLRPDLLTGRRYVAAGVPDDLLAALGELGADLRPLPDPDPAPGEPGEDEAALSAWCAAEAPLHGIIAAARASTGPATDDPTADPAAVTAPLATVWRAVRAVAVAALIPADAGGRILLLGPPRTTAPAATGPITAGLDNLARTLSVEWARFGLTAVCLDPGPATTPAELAELAGFVLSPAGGYLSGCTLRLGTV